MAMQTGGFFTPTVNPTVDTNVDTQTQYPVWLQQQINQLIGQGSAIANREYQAYPGQRIQGFSPQQNSAFANVTATQGGPQFNADGTPLLGADGKQVIAGNSWQPYLNNATNMVNGIGGLSTGSTGVNEANRGINAAYDNINSAQGIQSAQSAAGDSSALSQQALYAATHGPTATQANQYGMGLSQQALNAATSGPTATQATNYGTDLSRQALNAATSGPTATDVTRQGFGRSDTALDAVFHTPDTLGLTAPLREQQQTAYNNAANVNVAGPALDSLDQARNLISKSTSGPGAYDVALNYLRQGTQTFPQQADAYMNPYNQQVTDRLATLAGRDLSENILPAVNDTFTKAGQFGSSRNADFNARAIRDAGSNLLAAQGNVLQQGYGQSGQQFTADQNRALQAAQTAGGLYGSDLSRAQSGAGALTGIGSGQLAAQQALLSQQIGTGDAYGRLAGENASFQNQDVQQRLAASDASLRSAAAAQSAQGQDVSQRLAASNAALQNAQVNQGIQGQDVSQRLSASDAALRNAQEARATQGQDVSQQLSAAQAAQQQGTYLAGLGSTDYSRQMQAAQANQGLGALGSQAALNAGNLSLQGANNMAAYGGQQQRQDLSGTAAMEAAGAQQQQQGQQNLNVGYQDFLNQWNYPAQQATFMSSLIRGLPYNTNTQVTSSGPATTNQMTSSPLSQVAGAATGAYGLGKAFGYFAKGGKVKRPSALGLGSLRIT